MKRTLQLFSTLLTAAVLATSCTQEQQSTALNPSLFHHLHQQDVLQLTLEADWEQLIANKQSEDAPMMPVQVRWEHANGTTQEAIAKVGVRGHARRNICAFPPLKLKFSEKDLEKWGLNPDYKSLKLVTHCVNDNEELVLREYLTYRLLNELTDESFRVQLAKVTYKSAQGATEAYAFLIENSEEMAERTGGTLIEGELSKLSSIDATQYNLMTVFQFMIGNTDWNMQQQHNIKMVRKTPQSAPTPVPYDFDYSGLVNAHYALTPKQLPIKSVRERFFQWRGSDADQLQATLRMFKEKKAAMYDLILNFEPLSLESRADMLSYLDSFYANLPQAPRLASR